MDSYVHQLQRTGGIISEFVNPKYKDASKTSFKSSTRLECMMQVRSPPQKGLRAVSWCVI
jgi:UDP-sugar pyrophosphorylase